MRLFEMGSVLIIMMGLLGVTKISNQEMRRDELPRTHAVQVTPHGRRTEKALLDGRHRLDRERSEFKVWRDNLKSQLRNERKEIKRLRKQLETALKTAQSELKKYRRPNRG